MLADSRRLPTAELLQHWLLMVAVLLSIPVIVGGCVQVFGKPKTISAPAITLPITRVVRKDLMQVTTINGLVSALPDNSLRISPAIAGKLIAIYVQPGDVVHRGQCIARLDARQLKDQVLQAAAAVREAQQAVAQAQTNLQLAIDTYNRQLQLYVDRIAAKKDVIAAEAAYKNDVEQLKAARAHVLQLKAAQAQVATQLGMTAVLSPISGVVADRFLNVGDNTDTAAPIIHVVNLSTVIIAASLPADSNAQLHSGEPASVHAAALGNKFLPAVIDSISPTVDTQTNTVTVRLMCKNPGGDLKEGQAVSVSILSGVHRGALAVPRTALVPNPVDTQGSMLYLYNAKDDTVSSVAVKTGIENRGMVEITGGVSYGQDIVANGAYGIPDGTRVSARWEWVE